MQIIGIAGALESGKNTVAGFLMADLVDQGYTVCVCGFATKVKQIAKERHGWNGVKDEQGRKLLEEIYETGMEESGNRNYWIDELMQRYGGGYSPDFLIICDVRRDFEAQFIRDSGALWLVDGRKYNNPRYIESLRSEDFAWRHDPVCHGDTYIANDRSLELLRSFIGGLVRGGQHINTKKLIQ